MVTTLEDLIAKTATQVRLTLEECTGELQKEMNIKPHIRKMDGNFHFYVKCLHKACRTFCTKSLSAAKTCCRVAVDWLI